MRILLAEDNTVNQHVAQAMLKKHGHSVDIVGNGQLAVEAVLARAYDLVLMDIQMPLMDGHEATRRIRSHRSLKGLPIVAVTAHAFAEERDRCQESGMDDFLAKPIKPRELQDVLERWSSRGGATLPPEVAAEPPAETEAALDVPVAVAAFRAVMRDAGIEQVVDATLELYGREAPVVFQRILDAVAAGDSAEIHSAAHMLKSSSANIRADRFAELLYRLEQAGRGEDLDETRTLMPEVEHEYQAVMGYLRGLSPTG